MTVTFIWYPRCSTCQKAAKWLDEHSVAHNDRHIVEENPTAAELAEWIARSGKPSKSFFNTSGNLYKELKLKDPLPEMPEEERYALLATNGYAGQAALCWPVTRYWWASSPPSGKKPC